jgi:SAM-dependent methyltransferase
MKNQSFYDCRYFKGYMEDWYPKKKLRVLNIVRELNLPKTGWAIDFGCGNGVGTDIMKKALPTWKVFRTDISWQAISNAKRRFPRLNFFELSDQRKFYGKFDFLFSHHVLEHVFDINETWKAINRLLKKSASMLHILPCGNSGSLEHRISLLVKNGIDKRTGRCFFEEPGHLRRLNTEQMNLLAGKYGFHLSRAYYSYHYWAAIDGITSSGPKYVLEVTNHKRAKNKESEIELKRLRNQLFSISILKFSAVVFEGRKPWRLRGSRPLLENLILGMLDAPPDVE